MPNDEPLVDWEQRIKNLRAEGRKIFVALIEFAQAGEATPEDYGTAFDAGNKVFERAGYGWPGHDPCSYEYNALTYALHRNSNHTTRQTFLRLRPELAQELELAAPTLNHPDRPCPKT